MDSRLVALLLGVLLGTVSESSLAPALPLLTRTYGVGPDTAQGAVSAGLLGAALAYLPVAWAARFLGALRLFRLGLALHAALALALALASSLPHLVLLRLAQGVATAMVVGLVPGLATSLAQQVPHPALDQAGGPKGVQAVQEVHDLCVLAQEDAESVSLHRIQ